MRIVVGVDHRPASRDAVALTAVLAEATGAEVVVAHVYPWDWAIPVWGAIYERAVRDDARRLVERASTGLGRGHECRFVGDESPAAGLHRLVEDEGADLLVLGSSHRGRSGRALLGSVAGQLVHGLACALAVAPAGYADAGLRRLHRIGVAYDGSPEARLAVEAGELLATRARATLTVLRAIRYPHLASIEDGTDDTVGLLDEVGRAQKHDAEDVVAALPADLAPRLELLEGPAAEALASAAADLDLLVVGSRGYGTLGAVFLGSVARALIARAPCPVVVVPRSTSEPVPRSLRMADVHGARSVEP